MKSGCWHLQGSSPYVVFLRFLSRDSFIVLRLIRPTIASQRCPPFHISLRRLPLAPASWRSTDFTWAALYVFRLMALRNTLQWMFGLTCEFPFGRVLFTDPQILWMVPEKTRVKLCSFNKSFLLSLIFIKPLTKGPINSSSIHSNYNIALTCQVQSKPCNWIPLVKKLSVKSGWNWLFIHKMPNVIPWILTYLKYSALPAKIWIL